MEFWLGLAVRYRLPRRKRVESPSLELVRNLLLGRPFRLYHLLFPFSPKSIAGGGWLTAARGSRLFFDRFFSLLNFFHAANHERRNIALHNLFFARFLAAKCLPSNLGLPLLRGLFILGLIPEIGLSSEKAKVGKNTAIKTSKLPRLKLLLLFLSLWPQR